MVKELFQPGLIVNEEFFDYPAMQISAKNWLFFTKYRFGIGDFYGKHDGVQLNTLQFGHADRHEGMMYEGISPKDCITIVLLVASEGYVCINQHKMKSGDIIIIDDTKAYDFVSSHATLMSIVSIHKSLIKEELPWLLDNIDKKFKDTDSLFFQSIESQWKRVISTSNLSESINAIEKVIVETIKSALSQQVGEDTYLTQGEKTALKVKSYLLESLEEKMSVQYIIEKFKISDKTLESSFKSLFGITPKRFIKFLHLNHAHEDLQLSDPKVVNVSDIAIKWGFEHFGRFSSDYKSLFGVHPSITLKL